MLRCCVAAHTISELCWLFVPSTGRLFYTLLFIRSVPCSNLCSLCSYEHMHAHTHARTHTHLSYGSVYSVQDNPGEPLPEETFTHSHLSWSSIVPYLLHPSNTIHGILPDQSTRLTVWCILPYMKVSSNIYNVLVVLVDWCGNPQVSSRQHLSYGVYLEVKKIIRTVLCCVVYDSCAHLCTHTKHFLQMNV